MERVSLLPRRKTWTETEHDAVKMLECYIASRGWHRPGEVQEVPLTVGHVQLWLRKTGARRRGREYARAILATLQQMQLLRDTGTVMKPRRQPRNLRHSYWWRVFEIVPIKRASWQGAYPHRSAPTSVASLCWFLARQGLTTPVCREFSAPGKEWKLTDGSRVVGYVRCDARTIGSALADLLSRRGLERPCEVLVAWARQE
jgi:hypothetical protein